jgi:hypothetical protein
VNDSFSSLADKESPLYCRDEKEAARGREDVRARAGHVLLADSGGSESVLEKRLERTTQSELGIIRT